MFRYQRKPQFVKAVRLTKQSVNDIATWLHDNKVEYETRGFASDGGLEIEINPSNIAKLGDYIVQEDNSFSVYSQYAFEQLFDSAPERSDVITSKDVGLKRAKIAAKSEF